MLENFIYEDHLGRRFVGLDNGVFLNSSDLRDYSWSYDAINSRISRFYRPITDRSLPLVINCESDDKAISVRNRLLELTETDIEAKLPGKVFVGDCYTTGYITASSKSGYLFNRRFSNIALTLTSDDPSWYRERKHSFVPGSGSASSISGGTDYPFDYPYDYALSMNGSKIVCDSIGSNAFKLLIFGSITDPVVVINGHTYAIKGTVGVGETLLIDSLNKTITLTTAKGIKVNWFDNRDRDSYIFEPIPPGQSTVSWSGTFGFELTVIEKRSEPRWT